MMERVVRAMNRPGSVLAAGAVGVLATAAVIGNLTLVSCESGSGWSGTRRAKAGSTDKPAATGTPRTGTSSAGGTPAVSGTVGTPASATPARAPSSSPSIVTGQMPAGEPEMRVRIMAATGSALLSSATGLSFSSASPDPLTLPAPQPTDPVVTGQVQVSIENGAWVFGSARVPSSTPLVVTPVGVGKIVIINGQAYPGRLRLTARSDASAAHGAFDVVEYVPLEEYLPGVVAKEMLPNWPAEAYRVQAVCARTYALHERSRSIAMGGVGPGAVTFDVESTDRDQVYVGNTSNQAAIDAVRATRGQVLAFEGKVLRAYFSSTCGGRTASAKDTWPIGPGFEYNLAAPIQARQRDFACQQSPLYRWQVIRDRRELAARVRTFGERNGLMVRQLGELGAVEALEFNADGRPSRFRVVEPGGKWFQLSGEEFRLACNTGASMPSGRSAGAPASVPPVTPALAIASAPPGGQRVPNVILPDIDRRSRVNSSDVDVRIKGSEVAITGRGFGHGVGMCQYCAKGFAERGEKWQTMVLRFYPGASIEKAY